jgi:hypothetical protein
MDKVKKKISTQCDFQSAWARWRITIAVYRLSDRWKVSQQLSGDDKVFRNKNLTLIIL